MSSSVWPQVNQILYNPLFYDRQFDLVSVTSRNGVKKIMTSLSRCSVLLVLTLDLCCLEAFKCLKSESIPWLVYYQRM